MAFERVQFEKGIRLMERTGWRSRTYRQGSSNGETPPVGLIACSPQTVRHTLSVSPFAGMRV